MAKGNRHPQTAHLQSPAIRRKRNAAIRAYIDRKKAKKAAKAARFSVVHQHRGPVYPSDRGPEVLVAPRAGNPADFGALGALIVAVWKKL